MRDFDDTYGGLMVCVRIILIAFFLAVFASDAVTQWWARALIVVCIFYYATQIRNSFREHINRHL